MTINNVTFEKQITILRSDRAGSIYLGDTVGQFLKDELSAPYTPERNNQYLIEMVLIKD